MVVLLHVDVIEKFSMVQIPASWDKKQLLAHPQFIYQLTNETVSEIDAALQHTASKPLENITAKNFVLDRFSRIIQQQLLPQVKDGIGVLIIKGLKLQNYSLDNLCKIHWGIGQYFGKFQLQYGQYLLRIEDKGHKFGEPLARNNNTHQKLWFHNDSCDMTAMMCVREAKIGGESRIVSSVAIHNKMLKERPELVAELYRPYYRSYRNIANEVDKNKVYSKPIIEIKNGRFSCDLSRPTITRAQRLDHVPKLSLLQQEALDVFEHFAESPEFCYEFLLDPGDILYMNNHLLLHSRQAFEDDDDPEKKRLLLRLHITF